MSKDQESRFPVVRTILDEDKIVSAEITRDVATGRYSYTLWREYPGPNDTVKRTRYLRIEHGGAVRRVLILVERALEELEGERFAETRRRTPA
jgi:hypothetical protein